MDEITMLETQAAQAKAEWEAARKVWRQASPTDKAAARKAEQAASKRMSVAYGKVIDAKQAAGIWLAGLRAIGR